MQRFRSVNEQISCLAEDLRLIVSGRWWRWITCWFGGSAGVVLSYRLDRSMYLLFGNLWGMLRVVVFPVFLLLRLASFPHEIHYRADIKGGLLILHPSLGVVVSASAVAGKRLVLSGGNCIGGRKSMKPGDITLGDDVNLGINAVVLGPLTIGNGVQVGAGSVVVDSIPDGQTVVGVPGRALPGGHDASVEYRQTPD